MHAERLATLIKSLFPPDVATEAAATDEARGRLHPQEEDWITRATPKRSREFTAGRICARRALARLGINDYPLLPGPDRVPVWPADVVGSISHTEGFCGVAVTRRTPSTGIGLDIESAEGLDEQQWPLVLRASERHWLGRVDARERDRLAKLMFSVKECAYKCQYCVHRRWLEFSDVEVVLDLDRGEFIANILKALDPHSGPHTLNGRFLLEGDWVLTGSLVVFTNAAIDGNE